MGMSDAEDGLPGHLQASKVPPSIVSKRRGDLVQQDLIWQIFAALFLHIWVSLTMRWNHSRQPLPFSASRFCWEEVACATWEEGLHLKHNSGIEGNPWPLPCLHPLFPSVPFRWKRKRQIPQKSL